MIFLLWKRPKVIFNNQISNRKQEKRHFSAGCERHPSATSGSTPLCKRREVLQFANLLQIVFETMKSGLLKVRIT